MTRVAQRDEVSPTYHGTTRDTGVPLPAFLEPYIFPRYLTDETRELSYLESPEMLAALADSVLVNFDVFQDWQQAFDAALTEVEEFPEVRRRVFQMLPGEMQRQIIW